MLPEWQQRPVHSDNTCSCASHPSPFQNGGIQPNVDPWTLSACPLLFSVWVFRVKRWNWHRGECAHTQAQTHAIDSFGMHQQGLNRVTSWASCSVLKLSTPQPCATYQDIYMILGVFWQRPLLTLKPWHLFALPVAMNMVCRWLLFKGLRMEQGESGGCDYRHGSTNKWRTARVESQIRLTYGLPLTLSN